MTDRLSDVASIILHSVLWSCYVVDKGQRYEWRSPGGRGKAGRNVGKSTCWATLDGRSAGNDHVSLRLAMAAAVAAKSHKRAA